MATCAAIVGARLPNEAAEDSLDFSSVLLGEQGDRPVREYTLQPLACNPPRTVEAPDIVRELKTKLDEFQKTGRSVPTRR